ncbi:MAG: type II toxin-antitoxin system RelB/DinJ family antitoxin [Candidatus Omnitrophica bacterium]|nr:type II toxin-antitoxin system RelB/DinJ family antitoxin [Candidatus Omnitrophota bacterium]
MSKTAMIRARIEPGLKTKAERVFRSIGLSATEALTIFYKQVEMRRGLPFDVVVPNEATAQTFRDTDAGRDVVICADVKELYAKLGI